MYKLLTNAEKWHNENKGEHQHFQKALQLLPSRKISLNKHVAWNNIRILILQHN